MVKLVSVVGILGFLFVTGCASGKYKARQEQREKMASSSGLYCEWVNGEKHSDIDVELNMQMAKRCDSSKPFTLTPYKNPSDQNGIMYCCATAANSAPVSANNKKSSGPASSAKSKSAPAGADDEIVEDK